eukprot:GHVO01016670.1.p1 GENE.GHVO01016670.1~~GHVO01016670.1.p1  ORF type:complete len:1987 (+),score=318.01 GHVO01016670.1:433-5961(+)
MDIEFTLKDPRPETSVFYFLRHAAKERYSPYRITDHQIALTMPDVSSGRAWFPTIPISAYNTQDIRMRKNCRCPYRVSVEVPQGFHALLPGCNCSPSVKGRGGGPIEGGGTEVFVYETTKSQRLLPNDICLYVGMFDIVSGNTGVLYPVTVSSMAQEDDDEMRQEAESVAKWAKAPCTPDTPEVDTNQPGANWAANDSDDEGRVKDESGEKNEVTGESPDSVDVVRQPIDKKHVCKVTYATLKGFSKLIGSTCNIVASALSSIQSDIDVLMPFSEIYLAFLPLPFPFPEGNTDSVTSGSFGHPGFLCLSNLLIIDSEHLHAENEMHINVFRSKHAIATALSALWIQKLLDVPPARCMQDYWIIRSLQSYFADNALSETFGNVNLKAQQWNRTRLFAQLVEEGRDTLPLSTDSNFPAMSILMSDIHALKCSISLNTLQAIIQDDNRWIQSETFFTGFLRSVLRRALNKGCSWNITTPKFFDRLIYCGKSAFIDGGYWRVIWGLRPMHRSEADSIAPTPDTLQVNQYQSHPVYNIAQFVKDVASFRSSLIEGTGCPQLIISGFLQLPKKGTGVDNLVINADQVPLQPPLDISKDGWTLFAPCYLSGAGVLRDLLPDILVDPSMSQKYIQANLDTGISSFIDVDSILKEFGGDVDALVQYHPLDLISRDQRFGMGFGYVGKDSTSVNSGQGPLYDCIMKRLASDWSNLEAEQRWHIVADTCTRDEILNCNPQASDVPIASKAGPPLWVKPMLCVQIIKYLWNIDTYTSKLIQGDDMNKYAYISSQHQLVSLPISCGTNKMWPGSLRLSIFEDRYVTEDIKDLKDGKLPCAFEIRTSGSARVKPNANPGDIKEGSIWGGGASLDLGGSRTAMLRRFQSQHRFTGIYSSADRSLIGTELRRASTQDMRDGERPGVRVYTGDRLPILWIKFDRENWFGRIRRYQSCGMWEQQLDNDNSCSAQLEAAEVMGYMYFGDRSVIQTLSRTLRKHFLHPAVRATAAQSLSALSRYPDYIYNADATHALLEYIRKFHLGTQIESRSRAESPNPSTPAGNRSPTNPTHPRSSRLPPLWFPMEMLIVPSLHKAVAQCRGPDNFTPLDAIRILLAPFSVDDSTQEYDASFYMASIIESLCHINTSSDSVYESIFQDIWRIFKLDMCIPSTKQVVTKAFLRLLSSQPKFMDMAKITYLSDEKMQFDFGYFLPILLPDTGGAHYPRTSMYNSSCTEIRRGGVQSKERPSPLGRIARQIAFHSLHCKSFVVEREALRCIVMGVCLGQLILPTWWPNRGYVHSIDEKEGEHTDVIFPWASQEHRKTSEVTAAGIYNASLFCIHLDEFVCSRDCLRLLLAVWEVYHDVLRDISSTHPVALAPFLMGCQQPIYTDQTDDMYQQYMEDTNGAYWDPNVGGVEYSMDPEATHTTLDNETPKVETKGKTQKRKKPSSYKTKKPKDKSQQMTDGGGDLLPIPETDSVSVYPDALEVQPSMDAPPSAIVDVKLDGEIPMDPSAYEMMYDTTDINYNTEHYEEWPVDYVQGMHQPTDPSDYVQGMHQPADPSDYIQGMHQPADPSDYIQGMLPQNTSHVLTEEVVVDNQWQDLGGQLPEESGIISDNKYMDDTVMETTEPNPVSYVSQVAYTLYGYMSGQCIRHTVLGPARIPLVSDVYTFLFGFGTPESANGLVFGTDNAEAVRLPNKDLVKRHIKLAKKGVQLLKVSQFKRKYTTERYDVRDWRSIALEMTEALLQHPNAALFIEAVDPAYAPDYYTLIKHPMWLKHIYEKVKSRQYESYETWKSDVFLVFRNCRLYNKQDSPIIQDCERVQSSFYSMLRLAERLLTPDVVAENEFPHMDVLVPEMA